MQHSHHFRSDLRKHDDLIALIDNVVFAVAKDRIDIRQAFDFERALLVQCIWLQLRDGKSEIVTELRSLSFMRERGRRGIPARPLC